MRLQLIGTRPKEVPFAAVDKIIGDLFDDKIVFEYRQADPSDPIYKHVGSLESVDYQVMKVDGQLVFKLMADGKIYCYFTVQPT